LTVIGTVIFVFSSIQAITYYCKKRIHKIDSSKRTEAESSSEDQPPEKKVELENENMEEYLERMAGILAKMIADQMEAD
jgi:hypothetical protein